MFCRTGCSTRDHSSWGACARAGAIQIDRSAFAGTSPANRDGERRLTRYQEARSQGLQPRNTDWSSVRSAFENGGVAKTPVTAASAPVTAA